MGLERILGWTILALLIANCQGKMTYFLKKVCLIYKRRGIFFRDFENNLENMNMFEKF